jgi:tagatose 6-phosphate kinase
VENVGVVSPNLAVDRVQVIEKFSPGNVYRPTHTYPAAGGKGVNVCRVIKALGGKPTLLGFTGGIIGKYIIQKLKEEGIDFIDVSIKDESRVCTLIVDGRKNVFTVINERGPRVSNVEIKRLYREYREFSKDKDIIIFSGSLPQGCQPSLYCELMKFSNSKDKIFIVDTSGEALRLALAQKPYMIKPNLEEFSGIVGRKEYLLGNVKNLIRELKRLYATTVIPWIIVSLGRKGVVFSHEGRIYYSEALPVKVVNSIGSGDALVAGFAVGIVQRKSFIDIMRLSVAAASANTQTLYPGICKKEDIDKFYEKVKIEEIH